MKDYTSGVVGFVAGMFWLIVMQIWGVPARIMAIAFLVILVVSIFYLLADKRSV